MEEWRARLAVELYEAAREAMGSGRVSAAALLASWGLEALGLGEEAAGVRDALLAGFEPRPDVVEGLLERLGEALGGAAGGSGPGLPEVLVGAGLAGLVFALVGLGGGGLASLALSGLSVLSVLAGLDLLLGRRGSGGV